MRWTNAARCGSSQVSVFLGDQKIKSLTTGEYFGELCLLEGHAPTATVPNPAQPSLASPAPV